MRPQGSPLGAPSRPVWPAAGLCFSSPGDPGPHPVPTSSNTPNHLRRRVLFYRWRNRGTVTGSSITQRDGFKSSSAWLWRTLEGRHPGQGHFPNHIHLPQCLYPVGNTPLPCPSRSCMRIKASCLSAPHGPTARSCAYFLFSTGEPGSGLALINMC